MKLRNKKTGEVKEVIVGGYPVSGKTEIWECSEMDANEETGYKTLGAYTSLAKLNEEWEDYEETVKFWYINIFGEICKDAFDKYSQRDNNAKAIGNYFETKEEAEKAVEKLKAWKRLKDKGFMFCGTDCIKKNNVVYFEFGERPLTQSEADEAEKDLNLLFGGEE